MAPFATTDDVEVLWQPLEDDQIPGVDLHLAAASAIIRGVVTDIDDRITAGTLDPLLATYVAASMVVRVLRNPEGVRSNSERIDDYEFTDVRDQVLSDGVLRLLPEELALLMVRRRRAFSIAPGREEATWAILERVARFRADRACV